MVHKVSQAVGVVENVVEAKAGWPPEITLKLKDGSIKKGKLSDFREPRPAEKEKYSAAAERPERPPGNTPPGSDAILA